MRSRAALVAAASLPLVAALVACAVPEKKAREPLGRIPHVVTSAEPEWIPFVVRAGTPLEPDAREKHLTDLRQVTFGKGDNAHATWSPDGRRLVFQSTRDGAACEQIYEIDLASGVQRRVTDGRGRATGAFFSYPKGDRVFFSQTAGEKCPPPADRAQGYVALDESGVFSTRLDGSGKRPVLAAPGYDAEISARFDGARLAFTSTRDGDLELYTSKPDGGDVRRVTHAPGYDGGAFFSPDGARLVWSAARPTGAALAEFRALLARGLAKPSEVEIMIAGAEGQDAREITKNGKANVAPSFLHDSRRVIFASNADAAPRPGQAPNFDIFVVDPDASPTSAGVPPLERVTFHDGFDSSPMFSPDGEHVVFVSSRHGSKPGETNIFVARWVE